MPLWSKIPSWFDLESYAERFSRQLGRGERSGIRSPISAPSTLNAPSVELLYRRVKCVRRACDIAEREAGNNLLKRFADLDIRSILDDLISAVTDMAMIIVGSVLTGAAIGGGLGLLAGGVGAFPGATAGALVGVEAGTWILAILGLPAIAEFFTEGLKPIATGYIRGISIAWKGPQERTGNPLGAFSDDELSAQQGAWDIALSHEAVVVLLLSAIVAYLTRGRGNAGVLANEMRGSERGARLAQWMLKHEDALKQHPDLKAPEPRRGVLSPEGAEPPPNRPSGKDKEPVKGKLNKMPLHDVKCFSAKNLPASKHKEFGEQLEGQEAGLNNLTVEEYLVNIANPVKRSSTVARLARKKLQDKLTDRFLRDFLQKLSPEEAGIASFKKAKEIMSNLAGLHNPDLSAGGNDIIGSFGDKQVNSSIGPQWKPKIQALKEAAQQVPIHLREQTSINVKLHIC